MDKPEVEDPELEKLQKVLDRMDRRSWRQFVQVMVALALGVAIADVIALILIGFCIFWALH